MGNPMKIRASNRDGVTEVRVLMAHEMESGLRKDADGATVPAWFITEVTAIYKDKPVLKAEFGPAVSKNPFLSFRFTGGTVGEKVRLTWIDNKGDTRSDEAVIT
jgi:sulfur-oxidizing protein SoxZ